MHEYISVNEWFFALHKFAGFKGIKTMVLILDHEKKIIAGSGSRTPSESMDRDTKIIYPDPQLDRSGFIHHKIIL